MGRFYVLSALRKLATMFPLDLKSNCMSLGSLKRPSYFTVHLDYCITVILAGDVCFSISIGFMSKINLRSNNFIISNHIS